MACAWVQATVSTGIPIVGTESSKVHKPYDCRSTAFAVYAGISHFHSQPLEGAFIDREPSPS